MGFLGNQKKSFNQKEKMTSGPNPPPVLLPFAIGSIQKKRNGLENLKLPSMLKITLTDQREHP